MDLLIQHLDDFEQCSNPLGMDPDHADVHGHVTVAVAL